MSTAAAAAAFAVAEAIRSGAWDDYLPKLLDDIEDRIKESMPETTPKMRANGQVWVWIKHRGWEIRGTGVTGW
jgi:hypothetical protein